MLHDYFISFLGWSFGGTEQHDLFLVEVMQKKLQGGGEGEDGEPFELKPAKALVSWLYGEWQTERWVPPRAVGGVVPKDARGGVKVPPMSAGLPTVRPPFPLGVILAARVAMLWVLVSAPV